MVHLNDEVFEITPTSELGLDDIYYQKEPVDIPPCPEDELEKIAFGRIFGTRSGDKGGCANLGVWAKTDMAFSFLSS